MNPIVIYHGGCTDGVAAAWACQHWLGKSLDFVFGIYNKPPPDVSGRQVYIVDFSYKTDVMRGIIESAEHVHWMDHHESAQQTWDDLRIEFPAEKLSGAFDQKACGALLTWRYLAAKAGEPQAPAPKLLEYIDDRDRWVKKMAYGDEIIMALRSYPHDVTHDTMELWTKLMVSPAGVNQLRREGASIMRYYDQRVDDIMSSAHSIRIGGYLVPGCNCPFAFASDVAGRLAEQSWTFAACYWITGKTVTFSLRSRGKTNVAKIAEALGGGGHPGAAGFRIDIHHLDNFLEDWHGL